MVSAIRAAAQLRPLVIPLLASEVLEGMVKGKTKVRFELSGYEEPLNRIFHFLRYTVLTLVALVLFIGSCILCTTDFKPILPNGVPLLAVAGIVFSIALAISGDQFLPAGFHGLDGKTNQRIPQNHEIVGFAPRSG